jgi:peptidoglycan hydrolase-like protein with peptidoglycan-binding domain/tellurite resistance protein
MHRWHKFRISRRIAIAAWLTGSLAWFAIPVAQAAGATPAQIESAQTALNAQGFDVGTPDGIVGPRTQAAILIFQGQRGLERTGRLDAATLARIAVPASPPAAQLPDASATTNNDNFSGGGGIVIWLIIIGIAIWYFVSKGSKGAGREARSAAQSRPKYQPIQGPTVARPVTTRVTFSKLGSPPAAGTGFSMGHAEQSRRCWLPAGQSVVIAGYTIDAGLLYVGSELTRQDGYGTENCLINPAFGVATGAGNDTGAGVPYWPSYSLLDPVARQSFLRWLAGGRQDPSAYIGYVFLYFYGLERRLMLDNPGEEAVLIISEVRRLQSIYHDNHSFERYAAALLSAASVKYAHSVEWPPLTLRKTTWQLPLDLLVCLGSAVAAGTPLNATQVLTWYNSHPDKRLPTLAGKCPDEFTVLFATRFAEKFPSGLKIAIPKRTLGASYRAASGTFSVDFKVGGTEVPDVSGLSAPLNLLDPIVQSCTADLGTYARLIGKDRAPKNMLAAAASLPVQLLATRSAKPLHDLQVWLDAQVNGEFGIIKFKELLNKVGIEVAPDAHVAKGDWVLAANALSKCNFGMEPDARIAYPSPPIENELVVFRAEGGTSPEQVTPEYLSALMHIDIGMMVATSDGSVVASELQTLEATVVRNAGLSALEKKRLAARMAFLAKCPPSSRTLSRFKDRPLADREAIARLAISIAAADGVFAVEEVKLLEKIYKVLELPAARLYSDIQTFNIDDETPTIATADPIKGIPIPARPMAQAPQPSPFINLTKLARIRADTAVVSTILGDIFRDEEMPGMGHIGVPLAGVIGTSGNASRFAGLDAKYAPLMAQISARDSISRGEFEALAGAHNLMCDGAIEAINEWAFDRFDGPVLDDGPEILINKSVMALAEGSAA